MKEYTINILKQAEESLVNILKHKQLYFVEKEILKNFAKWFYEKVETLTFLPERWFNLTGWIKSILYKNHLIIYKIEKTTVFIIDIVDPKQHMTAKKYFSNS